MKRFFVCIALSLSFALCAEAQYAVPSEGDSVAESAVPVLKRYRSGLKLDGVKLSREEQEAVLRDIGGIDYNQQWDEYVRKRKLGANLTGIGSGIAAVGATAFVGTGLVCAVGLIFVGIGGQEAVDDYTKGFQPWFAGSAIVTGVGAVMAVAGLPMLLTYNHKLRSITDEYNRLSQEAASVQLSLGPAPSGLGLVLTF